MAASAGFSDENKASMLLEAASSGNLRLLITVAKILDDGKGMAETIKGIEQGDKGYCALHLAAAKGKTQICQYLIEDLRFDVDLRASLKDETPLFLSAKEGRVVTAKYLINHGADPNATDNQGLTPLHTSAEHGHIEIMELLLSNGVPVDTESFHGTPLQLAAKSCKISILKFLVEHGADVNKTLHGLNTPLVTCLCLGSMECAKLLIEAGADVNLRSPLEVAICMNSFKFVKFLLDAGSDPSIPNEYGRYPIETAITCQACDKKGMVEMLFPFTCPIPRVKDWSVKGILKYAKSAACYEESGRIHKKMYADFKANADGAFKKGEFLLAIFFYTQAMSLVDAKDPVLFANRSLCWHKLGEGGAALNDAQNAQILKPDWFKACYRKGAALMLLKEYEKACGAFMAGLRLKPTNMDLQIALREAREALDRQEKRSEN